MRKKNEKIFWDMEIIGNRRKNHNLKFPAQNILGNVLALPNHETSKNVL